MLNRRRRRMLISINMLTFLCALFCAVVVVDSFLSSTVCPRHSSSPSSSSSLLLSTMIDRRGFVIASTTTAAAVVTTTAVPAQAATPEGASLVPPGSLVGKTIVITGASTGLGLESAKDLARGGATVVLTARTDPKGVQAVAAVQDALNSQGIENPRVLYVTLDLDSLANVKEFPQRYQQAMKGNGGTIQTIDVLLNNAGVMAIPDRQLTRDGLERTFQSNHLGHFVLTAGLVKFLSPDARIINVSSLAYKFVDTMEFSNLNSEQSYGPWKSYGASKLANLYFTQELQLRAQAAGKSYQSVALHPGAVNTDLARNFVGPDQWGTEPVTPWEKALNRVVQGVLLTPDQGAATQVYLAATGDPIEQGAFYNNRKPERLPDYARDPVLAQKLWESSEQLSGVKFDL